jgi:ABC-type antimicrobial peptide transport system permease subunit
MVAFAVGRQLREAAIRLALGARPSLLQRRVLLRGLAPAAAGLALGLLLAWPVGHAIRAQLFQVRPADPIVLAAVALAVVAAALLASFLPARRAARVDAAAALRQE